MFEQLDDGEFDRMYQIRSTKIPHDHAVIALASVHLSEKIVEQREDITLSQHGEKNLAVIGYDGQESFVLSTKCDNQASEFLIEVSTLIDVTTQNAIVDFVLKEFQLSRKDCIWLNPSLLYS